MYKSKGGAEERQEEFFCTPREQSSSAAASFIVHVVKLKIEGKTFAALFFVAFCSLSSSCRLCVWQH